ncbi:MAG: domain containing protein, partial [Ilumatobacteraceae bacterium]|nr:domain containing protein [Ilumatobacteraceae bacterium]
MLLGRTAGTTGTTDTSVLYRVNAGGPTLASADDGPDWASDNSSTSPYHNTGTTATTYTLTAGTLDSTVPTGDLDRPPAGIFNTERYDPATGSEMQWNFNVAVGTPIQVRLYMANKAAATNETGERVFDVDLDATNVIDNIDLSNSPGHNIGTMRSFNIVSDGQVNILFRHGVENPLIDAIEIVRTDVSNTGTVGTQDDVQRRSFDGTTAGASTVAAGTIPWNKVRGSFMVNNTLYTLSSDGTLVRRTYDGTTFGPGTATFTYANGILSEVPTMTGIFFDPATSRIYYTLSGQSTLYYRSFLPEDSVIGAIRGTATGTVASLNPTRVRGMFLAGGNLYFADNTTGFLQKIGFSGGAVTGTATLANNSGDWRARAMFLTNAAQPNVLPTAAFTSNCTVNSCTFDGSTSTDSDGGITGYAWTFGDTQTGTGINPSHSYSAGGTYPVSLTVTDNSGGTNVFQANVTVTDPPNVAPTASFTSNCTLLSCTFNAAGSTDSDGTISTYTWNFGDTTSGTGVSPTHPYSAAGTYNVSLTVTDDDGAPATTTSAVSVVDASGAAVYRAGAVGQGSSTSATVQVPAAIQVGDRLVLIVTVNLDTTLTTPAGWALLGTQQDGTPDMRSWVFTRAAVAGTAGSNVTATMGAAGKSVSTLLAYSNAQAPTVLASSVMGASTTALTTPAVNVANSGSAVINYWSDKSATDTGWVLPGTVTSRATGIGTGSGHITVAAADKIVTTGSWAAQTANSTVAGTKGIGWSIVVPSVTAAPVNNPPVAAFTSSCTALACTFNAAGSSDSDGTIAGYAWSFGDTT